MKFLNHLTIYSNGNYLGLLELSDKFDSLLFLNHIKQYEKKDATSG